MRDSAETVESQRNYEEAFQMQSEEDFNKIDLSIRGELPAPLFKQFTFTFNPWSDKHWLKARFFDNPDENTLAMTTNYMVNEFLGQDDIDVYEKMKEINPKRYRIEGLGEWGVSEGLIYSNWTVEDFDIEQLINEHRRDKDARGLPSFVSVHGMDFGYTDPTAFVGAYADKRAFKIYVFYEFHETCMENRKIAQKLVNDGFGKTIIRADGEDPRTINELRLLGLNGIKAARKGSGSVLGGIQKLQDYQIIVNPRCENMIISLSQYSWKRDKNTDKILNEPDHEYSHLCLSGDTLVYTLHGKRPIRDLVNDSDEMVYSYNLENSSIELRPVLGGELTAHDAELYQLELEDGQVVKMTGNHKVLTTRGYVQCCELTEDDEVLSADIQSFAVEMVLVNVKRVRKLSCKEDVYNINVDVNHNYCVADGMVVKNCDALRYGCEDLSKFGVQV